MEHLGLINQVDFIEGVFQLLKKTDLVKEGKHYETGKLDGWDSWDIEFYDKVFDACRKILDVCAE